MYSYKEKGKYLRQDKKRQMRKEHKQHYGHKYAKWIKLAYMANCEIQTKKAGEVKRKIGKIGILDEKY